MNRVFGFCLALACATAMADVGPSARVSRVPAWNASGLGPLPWQGISCVDLSPDGKWIAVGTMAPRGDPNVFLLDAEGKIIEHHAVGQRWISEVAAYPDGAGITAICTTPRGDASEVATLFEFSHGKPLGSPVTDLNQLIFQYGDHSNQYARSLFSAGSHSALAVPEGVRWSTFGQDIKNGFLSRHDRHDGRILAMATSPDGLAAVGTVVNESDAEVDRKNIALLEQGKPRPIWFRAADDARDVETPSPFQPGLYGPHTKLEDKPVWGPLSLAIDAKTHQVAAADYQGYERFVLPRTADERLRPLRSLGVRFTSARPTIHVYDAAGKPLCTFAPALFEKPFWADLAFVSDGQTLLAYPHHWTSRGLAGQPCLPSDEGANTLYVLSIPKGSVHPIHFPDAISDVAVAGSNIVCGCWNGRAYLLAPIAGADGISDYQPIPTLPQGIDVGAASLVKASTDGSRILIVTATGVLHLLDASGREICKNDLAQSATHGEKPWTTADRKGTEIGPHVWRNNTGRCQSDLGNQIIIDAPDGLILIDPNSGDSFEQNWATIKAEGLDPMQVKYILPSHEHGDHAPGAYLWRIITGAKVIASPEMAYTLQHDLPYTSGYGFSPPVPVDILVDHDTDMNLCGLPIRILRLPGHTYGSMGTCFTIGGKKHVSLGDLIMPDGPLGYSGSVNFWPQDVLDSLKKLDALKPDYVLCGHGNGTPDHFIAPGIAAGEATGWGKMTPPNPDATFGFAYKNYQVVGWLETIYAATFGDIDGDGHPDIAIVTPGDKGVAVKIYLNKQGRFGSEPDCVVDVPGMGPADKVRINHLTSGKVADLMVASEQSAVLLLADSSGRLSWHVAPLPGTVRAASFAADRKCDPPEAVIGERFVQGCRLVHLQRDGSITLVDGPKLARTALEAQLVDLCGNGSTALVTSGGEIFLRGIDGRLPAAASITLERPFGDWTYLGVGDFNGDGKPDIVQIGMSGVHAMAAVFYNTGDAHSPFHVAPDAQIDLGIQLDPIRDGPTVADYNGDGIDDLIIGHSQRQEVMIIPGSRGTALDRKNDIHVKLDYRLHYDTKMGVLDLMGDGQKSIVSLGTSIVGAGGVYVRMPEEQKR